VAEPASRVRTVSLSIIVAAAVLLALREAGPVVVPVLVSLLCAYALEPAVALLMRCRLPRPAAALVLYLVLAIAAVSAARLVHTRVTAFLDTLPNTIAKWQGDDAAQDPGPPSPLDRLQQTAKTINQAAAEHAPAPPPDLARVSVVKPRLNVRAYLFSSTFGLARVSLQLGAIALLTFLLLATGDLYKRKLVKIAGPRLADRQITLDVMSSIDHQIERYLVVRVAICAIVAVATGLSLALIGVENAAMWGLVAGVLNVLPYIGPSTSVVAITIAAFLQFKTLGGAAAAGGAALVVAAFEGHVISPLLMSRAGEINTVAVFVSVLVWGWMWDVWGLLLAVPIMVAVKAAADHIESMKPVGELLGR